MSITAVSSQSGQTSQSDTASLEASKEKIAAQIQTLQKADATKNAQQIQVLQQQLQQLETQIAAQKAKSQAATSSVDHAAKPNATPAYSVQLSSQETQTSAKNLSQVATTSAATTQAAQSIDLSV